jgi:hypothetical protein
VTRRTVSVPERHPEDLPWNDVAADSDTFDADPEPDPAEVVGDEDDDAVRDAAAHRVPDPYEKYRQETLDARLAEEEPEATLRGVPDPEAGELEDLERGGDDVDLGEDDDGDDEAAEEGAIHLRRRP